jgi:hypothetical protein
MDKINKKLGFENDMVRLPGQSVDEELSNFFSDTIDSYLLMIVMATLLIVFSITVWFFGIPNPVIIIIACIPFIMFAVSRLKGAKRRIHNLKQGRDGERYVGQLLEQMRPCGYHVFHDVIGPSFNLDHVLVGPCGIFLIETKTWSKNSAGGTLSYVEGSLILNGKILDKNPIDQVKASARWLHNELRGVIDDSFSIVPVITLPSWFIVSDVSTKLWQEQHIVLINPKNIENFLKSKKNLLPHDDVIRITGYLDKVITKLV